MDRRVWSNFFFSIRTKFIFNEEMENRRKIKIILWFDSWKIFFSIYLCSLIFCFGKKGVTKQRACDLKSIEHVSLSTFEVDVRLCDTHSSFFFSLSRASLFTRSSQNFQFNKTVVKVRARIRWEKKKLFFFPSLVIPSLNYYYLSIYSF